MNCTCIVEIKMIWEVSPKISFGLYYKVEYDKDKSSDGRQFHNQTILFKYKRRVVVVLLKLTFSLWFVADL